VTIFFLLVGVLFLIINKLSIIVKPDKWTQVAPARAEEKARAGELFKLISKAWTAFAEGNPDPGR